jgi:peptidyl-prolyl cis-trans isomerase C
MKEGLRKSIQREYVISQAIRRQVDANVEVTDADVAKFKEESPEDFRRNQRVRIRQLILQVPKDATPAQEEQIRVRAEDILLRIKAGAPFAEMMEKYSEHESSTKDGGILEYSRGELSSAFDRAFDMNPGEVSDVFRTSLGFHVLRVESKQDIRDYLLYARRRQAKDEWVGRLREKARIMVKGEKKEQPVE